MKRKNALTAWLCAMGLTVLGVVVLMTHPIAAVGICTAVANVAASVVIMLSGWRKD